MTDRELKLFLNSPSYEVAPKLIGRMITHRSKLGKVSGLITEVEAYQQDDPASHSYGGETQRNKAMFGPSGHAYIYLSYGMHWCLNVVTGDEGYGSGVLVRGVYITEGQDIASRLRFNVDSFNDLKPSQAKAISNGPGKVTQALGVTKDLYGISLLKEDSPLRLEQGVDVPDSYIISTPRIGISKAIDKPWRWLINSEYFKDNSIA